MYFLFRRGKTGMSYQGIFYMNLYLDLLNKKSQAYFNTVPIRKSSLSYRSSVLIKRLKKSDDEIHHPILLFNVCGRYVLLCTYRVLIGSFFCRLFDSIVMPIVFSNNCNCL
jgi:hypothetical protein